MFDIARKVFMNDNIDRFMEDFFELCSSKQPFIQKIILIFWDDEKIDIPSSFVCIGAAIKQIDLTLSKDCKNRFFNDGDQKLMGDCIVRFS